MEPLLGCSIIGRGTGCAPGVVLLHSSMSTRGQWKKLAVELGRDHTVLSIDLIGYGESPMPAFPEEFTLDDEIERVLAYASHSFGAGAPFLLAGHSYGGAVALELSRRFPRLVRGVAVYEPVCFNLLDAQEDCAAVQRIAATVTRHVLDGCHSEAARQFFDFWNGQDAFDALPEPVQRKFAAVTNKVMLDFQALRLACRLPQDYACIGAPAMLLGGTRSPRITRRIVERLGTAIPGVDVRWVDGEHMAPATTPERVNPLFAQFLRSAARERELLAA